VLALGAGEAGAAEDDGDGAASTEGAGSTDAEGAIALGEDVA
jgi:hypothetical protein